MDERRWLLAIDTSTDWAGLALTNGSDWVELNWSSGRKQTTQVMPEIERLMAMRGIDADELAAIAVATGPGSFSGLRVGLSIAKGFVLAMGAPLIGVSTLEATVHGWDAGDRVVVGVVRAGRRRYVWAERGAVLDLRSGEIGELIESAPEGALIVGELDAAAAEALAAAGCSVPPDPFRRRRAGALAAIAWDRWTAGRIDDPVALEPIYVHPA